MTYRIVVIDTHPAAVANGAKVKRDPIGSGLNYWPHTTRVEAERTANHLNRLADGYANAYIERIER